MRPNCVYGAICTSALVPVRGAPWAEELARAPGGKKLGKQWSTCCPAHDDRSPSLIIFEGRTGAVQVRCMTGCEPIEIIAEILWHEAADRLPTMQEVFIDGGKTGQDIQSTARDGAVVLSLALQHGITAASIRHAVTRNESGEAASIVGAIADALCSTPEGES